MFGFMGKVLVVDLTSQKTEVLKRDVSYYQKYLGGSFLAAKLFDEQVGTSRDINPFSAANPIVFAPGVLAGASICGATRVNVLSLSPECPGVFLSQAGGEFGPNIKRAGYDALIVKGQSSSPVYININNDKVLFKDASEYWGKDRVDVYQALRAKLDKKYAIASVGVAGENRICNANLMFEPDHYAGRGGLGAVIGAKNLKAICIIGDHKPEFADDRKVKDLNKAGAKSFKNAFDKNPNGFLGVLRRLGTWGLLQLNQEGGNLPVRNFKEACLDDDTAASEISHKSGEEYYVGKKVPCKACYVACKKTSKSDENHTALAEYESLALLGPNLGITDPKEMMEACELCNRLGVDTISMGNMVSFVMDCFENGVLDEKMLGFSLKFGDIKGALKLITDIVERKGRLGALMADGMEKTCQELGEATRFYMRFSKGVGIPAHLPRVKPGIGFGYLHGPNPADHMKLEHDWIASAPGMLKDFGLDITSKAFDLDNNKVEIARATQIYASTMDSLSMCMFIFGPGNILSYDEIVNIVNGATGFDFSFSALMKIGENAIQLQKKLYTDFGGTDEKLLPYMEQEIPSGPTKGLKIDGSAFEETRKHYYKLWNWDDAGRPNQEVLDQFLD
ncbi:MAG: hypothetical protein HOC24_05860 [Deltaproteobacteria bacterium]|jgi:aldehyde:ferredoxin oxidoreductase|nr:hypothetical protein [Deltaproteobacteria bacterium]